MTRPARTSWKQAGLLVAFGVLAAFLAIEIGVRIATHSLFTWGGNELDGNHVTDPMVGRLVAHPGQTRHPTKRFLITIGERGIRLNGDTPPRAERPLVLAVGDSFAFGDGVDDEDSWPATLERLTGGRVINAGMIAFGLDQAVLRAEQLIDVYRPDTIVVAFIPHDVTRCELSYWSGYSKPYFDLDGDGLRLHPAEIPPPPSFASLKRLLSLSMALDLFFPRFLHWQGPEALAAHHDGQEVACRLMKRLAALGTARSVRIVVLGHPQQPTPDPEHQRIKDGVLGCAAADGLLTLDLFPDFENLPAEQRERLFDRHLTAAGNRLVATRLATLLSQAPRPGDGSGPPAGDRPSSSPP